MVDAFTKSALFPVKVPMYAVASVAPVEERLVVDAFTAVRLPMNPLVNVSPVPVVLVVEALVM